MTKRLMTFVAGFFFGALFALIYADAIKIAILERLPSEPSELQDDPYSIPFGETWRAFPS